MLIRRKGLFRSVILEIYTKILDNVSTLKVFNKIQKVTYCIETVSIVCKYEKKCSRETVLDFNV